MRKAEVYVQDILAGHLVETDEKEFVFSYVENYSGPPVSLIMPTRQRLHSFKTFPPFFEGLLPEGVQLDALLRTVKIDKSDFFTQIVTVGSDLVGDVTVRAPK